MKKADLKKIILEAAEELKKDKDPEPTKNTNSVDNDLKKYNPEGLKDKLGAFFIVNKPMVLDKNTQLSDIVFKTTIFYLLNQFKGGLKEEEIVGIFKSKSEANKLGNEILKNFKLGIKEVETQAKQYKSLKASLKEKLKGLKK